MKFLLDTDTLIYLIKRRPADVAARVDRLPADDVLCMSFVSWAELLKGAERSTRKPEVLRRLDHLVREIPVMYPIDSNICHHYAQQSALLKDRGTPIGGNDLWIAAHALALDATLVTHNQREFSRISGLKMEDWVT
jgi:tRNA(fMet)-specific endonuclease VapC